MRLSYEAFNAIQNATNTSTIYYKELLQEKVNKEFENASDVYTVQKENPITGVYEDVEVRVNKGASRTKSLTNAYVFDDFKKIIYKNFDIITYLGDRFKFFDYTWIVVNTDSIASITNSVYVRRCNSKLKFYDDNNIYHELDCVASDKLINLQEETYVILPQNELEIIVKFEDGSKLIKPLKRFLINGYPWKVESVDGVSNIKNSKGFIKIKLKYDSIGAYDDVVNDIADGLKPRDIPTNPTTPTTGYSICITGDSILRNTLTASYSTTISNNGTVDNTKIVVWSISDTTKAQIVSQDGTTIKLKGLTTSGTVTLTATLSDNPLIKTDKIITLKTPF